MSLKKSEFTLYEDISQYIEDLDLEIISSDSSFNNPIQNEKFPKIIRRGEIILGKGEGYPSLKELGDCLKHDVYVCKHVSVREEIQTNNNNSQAIHAFFFLVYNPETIPKYIKGETTEIDYKRSIRLWRSKNKTLIEMVKICYEHD